MKTKAMKTQYTKHTRNWRCLVARPMALEDMANVIKITEQVDIGNTRADEDRIQQQITLSNQFLQGTIPPRQSILYLATELHDEKGNSKVVGQSKLQYAANSCWKRLMRTRRTPSLPSPVETDILRYSNEDTEGLEIAANTVLPSYRGFKIGKFQTYARIAFVLQHDLPDVKRLFADLLTMRKPRTSRNGVGYKGSKNDGAFPFYEKVVRPLLGDLPYDEADLLRYDNLTKTGDSPPLDALLGPQKFKDHSEPAVEIIFNSLPDDVKKYFAEVGKKTKGAESSLRSVGFHPCQKYDILDGGKYLHATTDQLKRSISISTKRLVSRASFEDDTAVHVFTVGEQMHEFKAIACGGRIHGGDLIVEESVMKTIEALGVGHTVRLLERALSTPKQEDPKGNNKL